MDSDAVRGETIRHPSVDDVQLLLGGSPRGCSQGLLRRELLTAASSNQRAPVEEHVGDPVPHRASLRGECRGSPWIPMPSSISPSESWNVGRPASGMIVGESPTPIVRVLASERAATLAVSDRE